VPGPFSGEVAFVTGASRGIGRAIALALADEGCALALTARDATALGAVAREAAERGVECRSAAIDLLGDGAIERAASFAREGGRPPYAVVLVAGTALAARLERRSPRSVEDELALDLAVPVRLARALLPDLLARGRGHIVLIGSAIADFPAPRLAPYSAAKAALRAFAIALDLETRRRGVRASVVEPIYVRTALGRASADAEPPLERMARERSHLVREPAEVGRAVVRLLHRPRPRVSVPPTFGALRGVALLARPVVRRRMALRPPRGEEDPDVVFPPR
jgi:short-subunit dehydrogenase